MVQFTQRYGCCSWSLYRFCHWTSTYLLSSAVFLPWQPFWLFWSLWLPGCPLSKYSLLITCIQYDYWIVVQLCSNHLHFSFLLIWRNVYANPNIMSCTVFVARLEGLEVMFLGTPRLGNCILWLLHIGCWLIRLDQIYPLEFVRQRERNRNASGGSRRQKEEGQSLKAAERASSHRVRNIQVDSEVGASIPLSAHLPLSSLPLVFLFLFPNGHGRRWMLPNSWDVMSSV